MLVATRFHQIQSREVQFSENQMAVKKITQASPLFCQSAWCRTQPMARRDLGDGLRVDRQGEMSYYYHKPD